MLSAPAPSQAPSQTYNGTVSVEGTPVEVKDGVAEMDGEQYYVSSQGEMVIDKDRQLLGYIENGKFMPMDDQHLADLKAKGYLEG